MEDENFEDELEGLNPANEDGDLSLEALRNWSWDNGGSGCGCVVYAEGEEIAEAAAGFYEDYLRDDLDEPDFDPDEDEIELDFNVDISVNKWESGEVVVTVPVSLDQLKLLARCAFENEDIDGYKGLEALAERITEAAISEAQDDWEETDEGDEFEDLSDASCSIANPLDGEEYNVFLADCIAEHAKDNKGDINAVESFVDLLERLIETHNESMW